MIDPAAPGGARTGHTVVVCDVLEKVFLDAAPRPRAPAPLSSFLGERTGFQVAWLPPTATDPGDLPRLAVEVEAGPGARVDVSLVGQVPVRVPVPAGHDDGYLRTAPGLYPDVLEPLPDGARRLAPVLEGWQSVWVDLQVDDPVHAGPRTVRVVVRAHEDGYGDAGGGGAEVFSTALDWVVRAVPLPAVDVVMTQWVHVDCLAERHDVEVWGEEHWRIVEAHLRSLAASGSNAVLTPLFTPPLDVRVGRYRTDCQLLGVRETGVAQRPHELDVTLLDRWIAACLRAGLTTIEVPPLFTQWGAAAAAPWWVETPTGRQLRFGWHTPATSPEYRALLAVVLPAVIEHLATAWPGVGVVWHISDEPSAERLPAYRAARGAVAHLLEGQVVVDAVGDPAFVTEGLMSTPVVASDAVAAFRGVVEDFWVYHCNAQHRGVSNRFIAMPGVRTRVLGRQLFASGARGFLHWGFDYWSAQLSQGPVDPFRDTTAGGAFPAGDAFLVYPGPDGTPWESIRHRLVRAGVDDHRALQLLRDLAPEEAAALAATPSPSAAAPAGQGHPAGPFSLPDDLEADGHLAWRWEVDERVAALLADDDDAGELLSVHEGWSSTGSVPGGAAPAGGSGTPLRPW